VPNFTTLFFYFTDENLTIDVFKKMF
ncbi:uncharacterized protein METZ01_LOCUS247990, partial [marine metagenome]